MMKRIQVSLCDYELLIIASDWRSVMDFSNEIDDIYFNWQALQLRKFFVHMIESGYIYQRIASISQSKNAKYDKLKVDYV